MITMLTTIAGIVLFMFVVLILLGAIAANAEAHRERRLVPRCEGCDCPGRCEAAALVRRTLAEMGVGG